MANNVTIGGVTVDADDPCALYTVLFNERLKMISGASVSEISSGSVNSQRKIAYHVASLTALDAELARLKDACAQLSGARKARFAIRGGFRRFP